MKTTLLILTILIFSGCTRYEFAQHGKTMNDLDKTLLKCEYEAQKATNYSLSAFTSAYYAIEMRNKCMKIEGYHMRKAKS